jgi:hypothetical protein
VTLRAFVKAKKVLVDAGIWSDKRMPKTGGKFPLSKARSFRVGAPGWRWRVIQVEADGRQYRVLITYHPEKENYLAIVGTPVGHDLLVLGALENHSTHRGWHVHAGCKSPASANSGRLRYESMRRTACGAGKNARFPFPIGDGAAHEIAAQYLKLPPLPNDEDAQGSIVFPPGGAS